jgi:ribosomal protein S18 acetylase RimI-like enzyme
MHIERAEHAHDDLVTAFARLMPQLSPAAHVPSRDELAAIVASPSSYLLVARDPHIVGALTLTLFRVPTGLQAQIHNVVVDSAARGRGIGQALTAEAVQIARSAGAVRLSLTSRDERAAAHRLYRRLGFALVPSQVYRVTF